MSDFFKLDGDTPPKGECALLSRALLVICLSGILTACATATAPIVHAPEPPAPVVLGNEVVPVTKPIFLPMPGFSEPERLRHAIGLLEVGRSGQAKV
jgi:hypothetical protein